MQKLIALRRILAVSLVFFLAIQTGSPAFAGFDEFSDLTHIYLEIDDAEDAIPYGDDLEDYVLTDDSTDYNRVPIYNDNGNRGDSDLSQYPDGSDPADDDSESEPERYPTEDPLEEDDESYQTGDSLYSEQTEQSDVRLSTNLRFIKPSVEFTISASFGEQVRSNTSAISFSFDEDIFEFVRYSAPENGTVVERRESEGSVMFFLMIPNYDAKSLGELTLRARNDVILRFDDHQIALDIEYVLEYMSEKSIRAAEASVYVWTLDGNGPALEGDTNNDGVVDLIDLSNIIDWFGFDENEDNWPFLYVWFDFNNNGIIDIYDIVRIARMIESDTEYPQLPDSARNALRLLITQARSRQQDNYTPDSWGSLQTALSDAEDVFYDTAATLEDILYVSRALSAAIGNLEPRDQVSIDRSALNELIDLASRRAQPQFTSRSWAPFARSLGDARRINGSTNATQGEIDIAFISLSRALNALVPLRVGSYLAVVETYGAVASARVIRHNGPENELIITISMDGSLIVESAFWISNNSDAEYNLGSYSVFVATSGNVTVDHIFITRIPS